MFVKKRISKRKQVRRRRVARPRTRVPSKTHLIKRIGTVVILDNSGVTGQPYLTSSGTGSAVLGTITNSTFASSFDCGLSFQFWLDSVVDNTDLSNLFDRYKITGVKLQIMYQQNTASSSSTHSILPVLHTAYDFDDATPPTAAEEVTTRGYLKTRILNANKPYSIFLKPRMPQAVNVMKPSGLVAINSTSVRPQWLDCGVTSVPHYGLKAWLANLPTGAEGDATCQLRIQPTYYLALKDTH